MPGSNFAEERRLSNAKFFPSKTVRKQIEILLEKDHEVDFGFTWKKVRHSSQQHPVRTRTTDRNRLGSGNHAETLEKLVVTSVRRGGPADREGTLQVGDRMLEINGIEVDDMNLEMVAHILRQSGSFAILLIEYKTTLVDFRLARSCPVWIQLPKPSGKKLDITVAIRKDESNGNAYVIDSIYDAGPTERAGLLNIGDQILEVNGASLRKKSITEVNDLLDQTRKESSVQMAVRPKSCQPQTPTADNAFEEGQSGQVDFFLPYEAGNILNTNDYFNNKNLNYRENSFDDRSSPQFQSSNCYAPFASSLKAIKKGFKSFDSLKQFPCSSEQNNMSKNRDPTRSCSSFACFSFQGRPPHMDVNQEQVQTEKLFKDSFIRSRYAEDQVGFQKPESSPDDPSHSSGLLELAENANDQQKADQANFDLTYSVLLTKPNDVTQLGVSLCNAGDDLKNIVNFIQEFGLADLTRAIHLGDEIVSANSISLYGLPCNEAENVLNKEFDVHEELCLVIRKPKGKPAGKACKVFAQESFDSAVESWNVPSCENFQSYNPVLNSRCEQKNSQVKVQALIHQSLDDLNSIKAPGSDDNKTQQNKQVQTHLNPNKSDPSPKPMKTELRNRRERKLSRKDSMHSEGPTECEKRLKGSLERLENLLKNIADTSKLNDMHNSFHNRRPCQPSEEKTNLSQKLLTTTDEPSIDPASQRMTPKPHTTSSEREVDEDSITKLLSGIHHIDSGPPSPATRLSTLFNFLDSDEDVDPSELRDNFIDTYLNRATSKPACENKIKLTGLKSFTEPQSHSHSSYLVEPTFDLKKNSQNCIQGITRISIPTSAPHTTLSHEKSLHSIAPHDCSCSLPYVTTHPVMSVAPVSLDARQNIPTTKVTPTDFSIARNFAYQETIRKNSTSEKTREKSKPAKKERSPFEGEEPSCDDKWSKLFESLRFSSAESFTESINNSQKNLLEISTNLESPNNTETTAAATPEMVNSVNRNSEPNFTETDAPPPRETELKGNSASTIINNSKNTDPSFEKNDLSKQNRFTKCERSFEARPTTIPSPIEILRIILRRQNTTESYGFGLSNGIHEAGVFVSGILPGGMAENILQLYDKIIQVNGFSIKNAVTDDVAEVIRESGCALDIVISRNVMINTLANK